MSEPGLAEYGKSNCCVGGKHSPTRGGCAPCVIVQLGWAEPKRKDSVGRDCPLLFSCYDEVPYRRRVCLESGHHARTALPPLVAGSRPNVSISKGGRTGAGRGRAGQDRGVFPTMNLFASFNFPKQCHSWGPGTTSQGEGDLCLIHIHSCWF